MYIEKIKIGSFGKLSDREFDLSEGINVLEGKNESGKSTLCEFIKFVFYGLSNKNVNGGMSERKRYISWKNNRVSGSIVICDGQKRYRIERAMTAHGSGYKDEITVVDLSSNTVVDGIKNPGEHFFGIPEEVFAHTVYVRQSEGARFNGGDIGRAVENIFYSADENVNTEKALKKLDEARVLIKHKKNTGRGMLEECEREREDLTVRLSRARNASAEIVTAETSLKKNTDAMKKHKADGEALEKTIRKAQLSKVLAEFEKCKGYKAAIEKYYKGKNEIYEATSYNGFMPDDSYASEALRLKNEIVFFSDSVKSYEISSDEGEVSVYSKELAGIIKDRGGKDGFTEELADLEKKSKADVITAVILALVAAVLITGGFMLGELFVGSLVLFGVGIAAAVGCGVSIFSHTAVKSKIKTYMERFDVDSIDGLYTLIEKTEESRIAEEKRSERVKIKEAQKSESQARLDIALQNGAEHLKKWGVTPEMNLSGIIKALEGVDVDIKEIKKNINLYDREIEKNEALLGLLLDQLNGFNEESCKEEYASLDCHEAENVEEAEKRLDFTVKAREALAEKINALEKRLAELRAVNEKPSELESRLNEVNKKIAELEIKYEAYVLAYDKIQLAGVSLRNRLAPGLSAVSGTLMEGLTDGKYKEIGVSDDLEMTYTFEEEGDVFTKSIDCVSSGTQDLAYISLRLALAALFGKSGKKLPVVFDEAFSRLDGERLANMLEVIKRYSESGAQILVLSSQEREGNALEKEGVNRINL